MANMPNVDDELLDKHEVAADYHIPVKCFDTWAKRRIGPPHWRLSGRVRLYRRGDLDRWMAACRVEPAKK